MANIAFGGITTTATTARQIIVSDTPGAAEDVLTIVVTGTYTTWSGTEANLGTIYITVGGVDKFEWRVQNTDLDTLAGVLVIPFGDGLRFDGVTQI